MTTSLKSRATQSTDVDNRWLKFSTFEDADIGEGAWGETVKPGISYKIDPDTMPLVIYRAAQDVFFVGPADGAAEEQTVGGTTYKYTFPKWGDRTAGDDENHLTQSSLVRRSGITSSSVAVMWQ